MRRTLILLLLFLPGIAFSAICKSVGPDGVASFINVPGSACPPGSTPIEYPVPATKAERIRAVETGISGRQIPFAGYRSIEITSPEDGGTVRNNQGRVTVIIAPDPRMQPDHFITAYLDGMAGQGRYGSTAVEFSGVERGEHELYVTVEDSKGKVLTTSDVVRFTLQKYKPNLVVNPITGDDYVDSRDPATVLVRGLSSSGPVELWFPVRNWRSKTGELLPRPKTIKVEIITPDGRREMVTTTYNWEIEVPREFLETESSFEARAGNTRTTSTHSVDPALWKPLPGDFTSTPGQTNPAYPGVSTTPGQTNPAFPGVSTTPGQTNPAFPGVSTTPGKTNPAYQGN